MSISTLVVSNPSISGPRLHFGSGVIEQGTNCSIYFPNNPDISGSICSDWALLQWQMTGPYNEPEYLNPTTANLPPESTYDPYYGPSLYSVSNSDATGSFSVFQSQAGTFVYDIQDSISPATAPSGLADPLQDIFLSTTPFAANQPPITMNHPLTVSFDERIAEAEVSGSNTTGSGSNNPVITAILGTVLTYNSATFHATLFLQTVLTDSRYGNSVISYQNSSYDGYTTSVIYNDQSESNAALPFISSNTIDNVQLNISAMLNDAITSVRSLTATDCGTENLANWTFDGLYLGTEISGTDTSPGVGLTGSVNLSLQLSNIELTQDSNSLYSYDPAPPQGSALISESLLGPLASDILWRQNAGAVYVWEVNGTAIVGGGSAPWVDPSWTIQGTGNFTGNGMSDILWQNSCTGAVELWTMNGNQLTGTPFLAQLDPNSGWTIQGTGDFFDNGNTDIAWTNSNSGEVDLWEMNGTRLISGAYVASLGPNSGWKFQGVGDFNGDGKSDILWQNSSSGVVDLWTMNGTNIVSSDVIGSVGPNSDWKIEFLGDFNDDGKTDILWQNSATGAVNLWMMDGDTITSNDFVGSVGPNAAWKIQSVGDFNGNGNADILWQNSATGAVNLWNMDGSTITSNVCIGSTDSSWQIQHV